MAAEKIGFAVIGAGLVGPTHAEFVSQAKGAELKVVCDLREDRGRPLAERYGADWVADYRAVMKRDDIQVVDVCLPTALHLEVASAAAEAGKHVIVEKPIELNLDRAHALIATCKRHGVAPGEPSAEERSLPGADCGTAVGHFRQIQDMVHAIREKRDPIVKGEDALPSLAVIQAIYESERSGKPVDVRQTVIA